MTTFVYTRPWNREQFVDLAKRVWPNARTICLSEHRSLDESGFADDFYKFYGSKVPPEFGIEFAKEDVDEIILRCRYLRNLKKSDAVRTVYSTFKAIESSVDRYAPEYAISITIDSYVTDIMQRVFERRGLIWIGIVASPVNGYFRVTSRGERQCFYEPDDDAIDAAVRALTDAHYTPNYVCKTERSINAAAQRLWIRNLAKVPGLWVKRHLLRDRLNQHYLQAQFFAVRYARLLPERANGNHLTEHDWATLKAASRATIYLPLQMHPESTIDYWSSDTRWIDYEDFVIDLINQYASGINFVVKEHPNVLGYRRRSFYRRIRSCANAVFVSPAVPSSAILEQCDGVMNCTSTVGMEAVLRGVPVFTDSAPYHSRPSDLRPISDLANFNRTVLASPSPIQVRNMAAYCLKSLLPGRLYYDQSWNDGGEGEVGHIEIAKSLREMVLPRMWVQ